MAAIGSIRKQSGLLIILIGMAMVLFLLGDIFSGGSSFLTQDDQEVGKIAGKSISLQDYEVEVQKALDEQYGAEGATEAAKRSVRERVWQRMVSQGTLEKEMQRLGLTVSADELLDQVKNVKPGSILYQYFTDPNTGQIIEDFRDPNTGGLNPQRVLQAIQNLLASENAAQWLPIERAIRQDIAMEKYNTLISKGLMISGVEAQQISAEQNSNVTFTYALKEFNTIPNDQAEPSEEELRAYYEKHKHEKRFELEDELRSIKLAIFELNPTQADIDAIMNDLELLKPGFAADSNDTAYVAENADGQTNRLIAFRTASTLSDNLKDTVPNAAVGTVFGPFNEGGRAAIHKLVNVKSEPDSVKASHILIQIQDGDTAKISAAKAKLDSLKTVAQRQKNFADLATEFSEDFGSAEKGGDLDWFTRGRMVAPFEKAAFNGKPGDMVIVESQFGVHLLHITEQTAAKPKYLMATVDRLIEPSSATADNVYTLASKFSIDQKANASFDAIENGRIEEINEVRLTDRSVADMREVRDMVKWIFEAEVGDVSEPFESERHIGVAMVTSVSGGGTMSFEQAKSLIYIEAQNEKKANMILSDLGNASTVEDAAKSFGTSTKQVAGVSFSQGTLPGGLGRELKVLGHAFGMAEGQVSEPIVGTRGVFVIRVDKKSMGEAAEDLVDIKRTESSNISSRVNAQVNKALEEVFGVEDYRAKYY